MSLEKVVAYTLATLITAGIAYLAKKFQSIDKRVKKIDEIERVNDDRERSRLKNEIVKFASKLERGVKPSKNNFAYIEEMYVGYKDLNGNSYIDEEIHYIRDKYNEFYRRKDGK